MRMDKYLMTEETEETEETAYTVKCVDKEGTLKRLIEYIGKNGNGGHSFTIVVDPDGDDTKSFGWDGDGSDRIISVE